MPPLPVENMYVEEAPTEETGLVLQSRPPLHDRQAGMGTGTVEALFQRDGVLFNALFGVAGSYLYNGENQVGPITGSGAVSMAGNEIGLMVTAGETLHFHDGASVADVAFPDDNDVVKVFTGAARFWAIRKDTGHLFFTPALAATINALDFITAETLPDKLLDGLWFRDMAILFGKESTEFWPNNADNDLPITPLEGSAYQIGIRATGCATLIGETFAWVGDDNVVYLQGPQPVSNPGLNAEIAASATCRLFAFLIDGREFLGLRLDNETHVFGLLSQRWSKFSTAGGNWAARCHAGGVFGGASGKTYEWGGDHLELGAELVRGFRAGFPLNSDGLDISNLILRTNPGDTPYLEGAYADPVVEMRVSRNAGRTWGAWRRKALGMQGAYRQMVQWRALGMASRPGFMVDFRVSDPVPFRVSDVLINEKFGGR